MNIYNYLLPECQQRDFENQVYVPKASLVRQQQTWVWNDAGIRQAIKTWNQPDLQEPQTLSAQD